LYAFAGPEAYMSAADTPLPPTEAPLSEGARIINVFIAPSKTFTDLQRNASWWGPFLVIALVALAYVFVMSRQIGFDQITKNEIAASPRVDQFEKLPPDQQAKQIDFSITITKVFSYGTPVLQLIVYSIIAGVLLGAFKLGANAKINFKTAMAIVIYGSLPGIVGLLLAILSMFAGVDKEGFNVRNPVATNPAYFMDRTANRFLFSMASALDVIVIWSIVLIGIGFACNSKVKRGTAIGIVAGCYIGYKLISGALGAMF
jgi:hypothetical protein